MREEMWVKDLNFTQSSCGKIFKTGAALGSTIRTVTQKEGKEFLSIQSKALELLTVSTVIRTSNEVKKF